MFKHATVHVSGKDHPFIFRDVNLAMKAVVANLMSDDLYSKPFQTTTTEHGRVFSHPMHGDMAKNLMEAWSRDSLESQSVEFILIWGKFLNFLLIASNYDFQVFIQMEQNRGGALVLGYFF